MLRTIENATLIYRKDLKATLSLFRFALENGVPDFQPGQFITMGLPVEAEDGKSVWRTYSIASPPSEKAHVELYVRESLNPMPGRFTSELWKLPVGGTVQHRGITGKFTMEELLPNGREDRRTLLLVGGDTGIAPLISCVLELRHRRTPRRLVVLHGARHVDELGYHDVLTRLQDETRAATAGFNVTYVPAISRPHEEANRGWTGEVGRAERLLRRAEGCTTSPLEDLLGMDVTPDGVFCHVCGYDGTVRAASAVLAARGFRTHRNRRPDGSYDLKIESYG